MRWIYVPKDEFDYYYGAEEVKAQIDYDCLMSFKDDAVVKMVEEMIDRFLTTSLFNSVYTLMNSTFAGFEHNMGMKLL